MAKFHKRIVFAVVSGLCICALPSAAGAQPTFDHLQCFKVKDQAKFKAVANLTPLQSEFVPADCEIQGKAKMFCIPVDKNLTSFEDKTKQGIPQVHLNGDESSFDRLCYKIKCPAPALQSLNVTDQFGNRDLAKFKTAMLCTPAIKGAPVTTTVPSCPDADLDGFNDATCGGLDCDDGDPNVNPSTAELCNGVDDNCDGAVDEGFPNLGQPCGSGVGACQASGTTVCSPSGTGTECSAEAGTPQPEQCDGIDNDCNGITDDGSLCPSGDVCQGGSCACDPGQHESDPSNCACLGPCGSGLSCVAGVCQ